MRGKKGNMSRTRHTQMEHPFEPPSPPEPGKLNVKGISSENAGRICCGWSKSVPGTAGIKLIA